jgi:glycosyltransferase involved in cell wall biosynthesis
MTTPLVSICCQTYNHLNYIEKCIEGFLIQKTTFKFEILIIDDASTDGTSDIINKYFIQYPNLIFPIINSENRFSKGISQFNINKNRAKGKYLVICEGDDYWIDPYKLQIQFDFLESNNNFSICFTDYIIYQENTKKFYYPDLKNKYKHKSIFSKYEIIFSNFIPTATVMFKNNKEIFPILNMNLYPGDWFLHIMNSEYGLIKFLPIISAVYRRHDGGICSSSNPYDNNLKYLKSIKRFRKYYSKNYYIQFIFILVVLKIRLQNIKYKFLPRI